MPHPAAPTEPGLTLPRWRPALPSNPQPPAAAALHAPLSAELPTHQRAEIAETLRDVAEHLELDGCGIVALGADPGEAGALYYCRGSAHPITPVLALRRMFPWTHQNLAEGKPVSFAAPGELPAEAALDRLQYEAAGIASYLALPLQVGETVQFFLAAHGACEREGWPAETVTQLRLIGEIIVMSLLGEQHEAEPAMHLERLICSLSGSLINVTPEQVDKEIEVSLERVRALVGFDRFGLAAFCREGELKVTHASYGEGITPLPEKVDLSPLFPWAKEILLRGQTLHFNALEELPLQAAVDRRSWQALGVKSNLTLPITVAGSPQFLLIACQVRAPGSVDPLLSPPLRLLGELCANALLRCRSAMAQQESLAEIERHKAQLQSEAEQLQAEMVSFQRHEEMVGQSAALARTLALTEQVAPTGSTVLITGETGTGKELVAQAIHKLGARRDRPMVKVNCASLPAALVESELFGREKGAYTGALTRQAGRFELADGGTIFLDEIAEMSLELQAKLLRVLQEGQFERLGSGKTIQVDVRVIAATNRNLAEEVRKGNFREDLYYRLNVFQIVVPPLRERVEDIPLLVWSFVREFGDKMGKKINRISRQDMAALQGYHWPGNVRELRNVLEHAVIVSSGDRLQVRLPENCCHEASGQKTLEEYEIMHIRDALRLAGWRIKGEGGAARLLGLNPSTLYSRMQKYGISNRPGRDEISP